MLFYQHKLLIYQKITAAKNISKFEIFLMNIKKINLLFTKNL